MLGHEIVRQLIAAGKRVKVLDLEPQPEPCCEALVGDIRSKDDVRAVCDGAEVVFQCAAAVWNVDTPAHIYEAVNVTGNQNVIDVCREQGIRRLVYTSTIDVVVDGRPAPSTPRRRVAALPRKLPRDPYCRTKIQAEKLFWRTDSPDLATCALRPVGMYGSARRPLTTWATSWPSPARATRSGWEAAGRASATPTRRTWPTPTSVPPNA